MPENPSGESRGTARGAAAAQRQEAGIQTALVYDASFTGPLGQRIAIRIRLPAQDSLRFEGVGIVRRRCLISDRRLRQRFSRRLRTRRGRSGWVGLLGAEPITDVEGVAYTRWY